MSYLTLFDAVTAGNLPSGAEYACFYVDGEFANEAAVKARCPHATYLSITVIPANTADCCDCETGDLTVGQVTSWVETRLDSGLYRPVVYASQDTWENQGLLRELALFGSKIRRWVAAYPGTGANVPPNYDAHQYSTGNLDTSVCLSNFFDGPPKPEPEVEMWSAQIQIAVPKGSTGTVRFHGSVPLSGKGEGQWTVDGLPGIVHWSGPGGGKWRAKGMDVNSPPLGK